MECPEERRLLLEIIWTLLSLANVESWEWTYEFWVISEILLTEKSKRWDKEEPDGETKGESGSVWE